MCFYNIISYLLPWVLEYYFPLQLSAVTFTSSSVFQLLDENVIFLPHKGAQEINEIFSLQFINSSGENIEVCNLNEQEFLKKYI